MIIEVDTESNEHWYLRAMIHRGMASLEQDIADAERTIKLYEADETLSARGTVLQICRNMKAYNEQLLAEARQYMPETLGGSEK